MKKKYIIFGTFIIVLVIFLLIDKPLLFRKLDLKNIDSIKIVSSLNKPEYGADTKVITNKKEISLFVNTFNNAIISKKVKNKDIADGSGLTKYYFYNKDKLVRKISLRDLDKVNIYGYDFYVKYSDETPYELYKNSDAKNFKTY